MSQLVQIPQAVYASVWGSQGEQCDSTRSKGKRAGSDVKGVVLGNVNEAW